MKSIGGYFELELDQKKEYHQNALKLNTGRNALEYILRAKKYNKIYLPYYICDVILEPIKKLKIDYEFYDIDKNLTPIFDFSIMTKHASFLYVNYFGLFDNQAKKIAKKCKNLIIDSSQGFFSKPIRGIDTFYSPRKFFGVPDGAYLYTNKKINLNLNQDKSRKRFTHLLGRIEEGSEAYYFDFKKNDKSLRGQDIKKMSKLTQKILKNINYQNIMNKRMQNFNFIHNFLKETNKLKINNTKNAPMTYPYLIDDGFKLKEKLIQKKIFVATYWPNKKSWFKKNSFEEKIANNLICLPIDQRYTKKDMKYILNLIKNKN